MPITDLTGYTWVGNSTITWAFMQSSYLLSFTSNNKNFNQLTYDASPDGFFLEYTTFPSPINAYDFDTNQWTNEAYKTITITGGTDATNATLIQWLQDNGTLTAPAPTSQPSISIGTLSLSKAFVGNSEISAIWLGNVKLYEGTPVPSVDPILANNSWAVIKQVCESGQASNYWAVGDTKTDLGTDGNTRTFRIADMQGLYNKHCVFEQVELVGSTQVWNASTNTDDDSCYNNWNISGMRNTVLPAMLLNFSSDLQTIITDTTIKTAKNGNNGTLVDTTQKLFLPAEKEVWTSRTYSRTEEFSALTTWSYWSTHTTNADHIKYDTTSTARSYWLRSPYSGTTDYVCNVDYNGYAYRDAATGAYRVAPCFAL